MSAVVTTLSQQWISEHLGKWRRKKDLRGGRKKNNFFSNFTHFIGGTKNEEHVITSICVYGP
jgi:hypothetical protein